MGDYPHVLHLIASLAVGGTERQLVQFIRRSTCPERHYVAVFDEPGLLAEQIPNPPVPIGRVERKVRGLPSNLMTAVRFRRLVRERRADLVHAHLGIAEALATAVPRSVPVVASRRGVNIGFGQTRLLKLIEGIGHRRADVLLCNSCFLADYTKKNDLWPPHIEVIYNGISLEEFRPAPIPPGPPTVVVVANLRFPKGQDRFLRAFRMVIPEVPQASALLVGDGPDRPRLEELAAGLEINRAVSFVGQVMDPRPYVAKSHLVCLTSTHEGFPNVLLEAMAMGRPVVATRVGGVPELVRHGIDGLLTSLRPEDIAAAIVTILRDEVLRARMGHEARLHARIFDWERVVRDTEAVYRGLLSGRPPGMMSPWHGRTP